MTISKSAAVIALLAVAAVGTACSDDKESVTSPTPVVVNLSAPALEAPAVETQLDTLRPTLTVRNATTDQAGTRTYEFQLSDSANFTAATTSNIVGFAATVSGSVS